MRTNIGIDDALLAEATRLSGIGTAETLVDEALKTFVRVARQREALEALRGIGWEGDLETLRDGGPKTEGAFDHLGDAAE